MWFLQVITICAAPAVLPSVGVGKSKLLGGSPTDDEGKGHLGAKYFVLIPCSELTVTARVLLCDFCRLSPTALHRLCCQV
jgi:hypothetical protein